MDGEGELVGIDDIDESGVCINGNIDDFFDWLEDITSKKFYTLNKLRQFSGVFITYVTYIRLNNIQDTKEYRKIWFQQLQHHIVSTSIEQSGFV